MPAQSKTNLLRFWMDLKSQPFQNGGRVPRKSKLKAARNRPSALGAKSETRRSLSLCKPGIPLEEWLSIDTCAVCPEKPPTLEYPGPQERSGACDYTPKRPQKVATPGGGGAFHLERCRVGSWLSGVAQCINLSKHLLAGTSGIPSTCVPGSAPPKLTPSIAPPTPGVKFKPPGVPLSWKGRSGGGEGFP